MRRERMSVGDNATDPASARIGIAAAETLNIPAGYYGLSVRPHFDRAPPAIALTRAAAQLCLDRLRHNDRVNVGWQHKLGRDGRIVVTLMRRPRSTAGFEMTARHPVGLVECCCDW
jgi:hypothetical protein